jgi:tRNA U38,U39,U40 pseudouridine synthase TruA
MLSKKFLHISNSSIAQQHFFKTQDGLMLPSLDKRVKERRGFKNSAAARSQIDPRVGKRRRRRRYLVGWKKFFFQVWEQKKQRQQQDLRMFGLQPKGSEANFSLPSFLLQQGRNNTSLHLQIEKNGRRDSRILSFASEQQKQQQKQQRQWLALHEFQVPPRRSQAEEEKDAAVLGFWLGFGCGRPGGGK